MRHRIAPFALCCALAAAGCEPAHGDDAPRGLLGELARQLDAAPALAPRLSIGSGGPSCIPDDPAGQGGCPRGAMPRPSARISAIAARAQRAVRDHADPRALHTVALIDLLYEPGTGKSLQRSISSLQTAARLTDRPAPVLADLAAAYIVRAERAGTPRDLLAAVEAAERGLEHEPRNRAALFNRALAMQRFGLVDQAAAGWREYLAADSATGWAAEARRNLRATLATRAPAPPPPDAGESAYAAYAAADPQGARELGWCRLLPAWGTALLAGDAAAAEGHLRRADTLGQTLERRPGGDATLADGVRAIRAGRDARARRGLAHAHREYGAACQLAERADFPTAAPRFQTVIRDAGGSPVLRAWARVEYGDMAFHVGDVGRGESLLRAAIARTDTARHPALAARARQALSALLLRGGRFEPGIEQAHLAAGLAAGASERRAEGIALDAMALGHFRLGDMERGYALAHRALERLRLYRRLYRLHNALTFTAGIVGDDGLARAAKRLESEGIAVTESVGLPVFVAEARFARARRRAADGDVRGAGEDVAAADRAVAQLTESTVLQWLATQRQLAVAAALVHTDPARAAAARESAAVYLLGMTARFPAFPAIVDAARAHLAVGNLNRGTANLELAFALLEERRDSVRVEPRHEAVFEAARTVVDRAVMLTLAAGDKAGALHYLDRGRASLAPVGRPGTDASRTTSGPAGEVAVEYAVIGDTLLAWTVAGSRVEVFRSVVDTVALVRTIAGVREQLETLAREEELRPALALLYDWLVRPVERQLGGADVPVVVIADGDLASVPFAALYDTARGRYLVQDRTLRFAASLRDARRPAASSPGGGAAVFVADPAFDPVANPGFERLAGSAREVAEIASAYPGARVLSDTGAHAAALRGALRGARMVHYAGHALFDDERPERSSLLLAPVPGRRGAAALGAQEIARLDLRHLSLVVLSACQTVRTGQGRSAGFTGLAGAFLAAGAGGAVGSLWRVDDRLTRPLMTEFHRAYRRSGSGPVALRDAQLRLLASGDASLRSPAAWAGFRYTS